MVAESDLLDRIRAAPDDDHPQQVYADWLLERGDVRGELIALDLCDRRGQLLQRDQINRLLYLATIHGFPRLPDDPDRHILAFDGEAGRSSYWLDHAGHSYFAEQRSGRLSIEVDEREVFVGSVGVLDGGSWTFRETTVILAILSDAIVRSTPWDRLSFPDRRGIRAHPDHRVGRLPRFDVPDELALHDDFLRHSAIACRDVARWHRLRHRQVSLARGLPEVPALPSLCACGIPGISCNVPACERRLE